MTKRTVRNASIILILIMLMAIMTACKSQKVLSESPIPEDMDVVALPSVGVGRKADSPAQSGSRNYTICIDPGHGFVDGGCGEGILKDGILEKDITFAIATTLNERLKELGYSTVMTHDGKTIPANADTNGNQIFSAAERAVYVNKLDIDYFVSIHVNSFDTDTSVSGVQVYYEQNYLKTNEWSEGVALDIAEAIETGVAGVSKVTPKNDPNYSLAVTRETKAAASLIEVGFCTNENDAKNMTDPEWQISMANAIADGINKFFADKDIK